MITTGSQGLYEWLVTDEDFDLLEICPEVVLGKYVAVTSFDSGQLELTEKETAAGWRGSGKIAYSPKIESADDLPRAGWDEWYIFRSPTDLGKSFLNENIFEVKQEPGRLLVFVNYNFAPHLSDMEGFASMFWQQMERVSPESYVADNAFLSFVTMNKSLFARVHDAVKALGR